MKLSTLRRIAATTAGFCILFNLFGVYTMLYTLWCGDYLMTVAVFVYLALASIVEYWIVMRIWSGKLLSDQWRYDD